MASHPLIHIERREIAQLPLSAEMSPLIVATGPLTSPALSAAIAAFVERSISRSSMPSARSCSPKIDRHDEDLPRLALGPEPEAVSFCRSVRATAQRIRGGGRAG